MALALRLGDFNFLISNQISPRAASSSWRRAADAQAAPFLTFD